MTDLADNDDITVRVSCAQWRDIATVESVCQAAAHAALACVQNKTKNGGVSILLTDDATLCSLNQRYRNRHTPTNVLSFPFGEDGYLGDVALAWETVTQQAKDQAKTHGDHLQHLVVHAVLHLLGYDHKNTDEARHMEDTERKILARLGVADPYTIPTKDPTPTQQRRPQT